MKATVILIGLLATAIAVLLAHQAAYAGSGASNALEPAWMMLSGVSLIALGSAVRRYIF
jgi:hypothetical protein